MKKITFGLLLIGIASCHPFALPDNSDPNTIIDVSQKTMGQLVVPDGFTFISTKSTNVRIEALDNAGNILKDVTFDLFLKDKNEKDSVFLMSATTNTEGVFTTKLELESTAERLIAITNYLGLPPYQTADLGNSSNITLSFGTENTKRDGLVNSIEPGVYGAAPVNNSPVDSPNSPDSPDDVKFTLMGRVTGIGVPTYLLRLGDVVSQDVLSLINASVPEGRPVPTYNPSYIADGTQSNVVLKDSAAVWITFVSEGAGYRNAVGYYSYPTNNPPKKVGDISKLNVIFPNASFVGSGGGLRTGDKVLLGSFSGGTTIGWFLIPDGWVQGEKTVSSANHPVHFSDKSLNTFTNDPYRSHVVLLNDDAHKLLLLAFEDLDRPGGDNDFNDVVFYATVSPYTAVVKTNLIPARVVEVDSDNDGVPDSKDAAPNDPTYAYVQFTPSLKQFGTLAFEDSYPSQGDYDMNDMVVDYQFEQRTNGANKVTQLRAKFVLRAMGASSRNGFGFELPISQDKIASVTGAKRTDNLITVNGNGTESRQQNAVFIPFDNAYDLLHPTDGNFANTEKDKKQIATDTILLIIKFKVPVLPSELGTAPFNPFIFVNRDRSREVHLAGKTPTNLANLSLFGTAEDNSGKGKYYQTKNNLPWSIDLPSSFAYPIERQPINRAYLKFNQWCESKGTSYGDWYKVQPNYQDVSKIY